MDWLHYACSPSKASTKRIFRLDYCYFYPRTRKLSLFQDGAEISTNSHQLLALHIKASSHIFYEKATSTNQLVSKLKLWRRTRTTMGTQLQQMWARAGYIALAIHPNGLLVTSFFFFFFFFFSKCYHYLLISNKSSGNGNCNKWRHQWLTLHLK